MIKYILATWILIPVTLVMAGGDVNPNLPKVVNLPAKLCNADKIYVEKDVNLMWQDQSYTDAEDGAYKREQSVGKSGKWRHAENYCRRLDYSGYTDWRLPTSDELQHVHRISGQVFTYFRGRNFWSSTPASKGKYYVVYPADAYRYEHKMKRSNFIRCVRCLDESSETLK